ncbi:MAG: hypothetical protein A2885_17265 [Sphingopyxis sp. RIFCSPHIGHO2_01_FULL_65_24]|nr:MAG: hypothetical protein A2885_17265 [Sphingopyxis sp. RIFCSPHIGHO2_01_FULL_65_24]
MAAWRHWDTAALCAGATPLVILALYYADIGPAAFQMLLLAISLMLYPVAATFALRQGDGWLAVAGGLLLLAAIVIALPLLLLVMACLTGDCI